MKHFINIGQRFSFKRRIIWHRKNKGVSVPIYLYVLNYTDYMDKAH